MTGNSLKRNERLRGSKATDKLFTQGHSGFIYPFRYFFISGEADDISASILVSVPKRVFKRAVKRNLLKRRTREAYRLNKSILLSQEQSQTGFTHIAFVYAAKEVLEYSVVENGVRRILSAIAKVQSEEKETENA